MAASADERTDTNTNTAVGLGFESGMVVLEVGYDDDIDHDLHDSVDALSAQSLLDLDYVCLADAVLVWFRKEDGDLTYILEYAVELLGEGGMIWLLTPKTGPNGPVEPSDIQVAARTAGLCLTRALSVAAAWNGSHITVEGN